MLLLPVNYLCTFETMKWINHHWEQVFFVLAVLVISFIISRVLRLVISRFIRSAATKLKVDPTRYNFFKNAVDFIIFLIAAIIIFRSIPYFRSVGTTLLTGAGVLAAIVGFASQSAFSNIISVFFWLSLSLLVLATGCVLANSIWAMLKILPYATP